MNKHRILILFVSIHLFGCLPQGKGIVSSAYNNLTAHYNAYWIASEQIKEIEQSLFDKYDWNYNEILPIYVPFDSTDAVGIHDMTQDCLKKASLAIQFHPESKWEYPSYILAGRARFYNLEFTDAIEAFKYVNTKSRNKNVRHEALVQLIRTFTKYREYSNAQAVINYLSKEVMNNRNQLAFYMNQAYFYQENENFELLVQKLTKAEEIFPKNKDRSRIQFIIGQVYQKLGYDSSAFHYYEKSLKNNPSYELSFYTKLNLAQVTELSEGRDVKTIRKYFKKLLSDRKNFEYYDKIYFEMALFEEKNGNLSDAIDHFITSVRVSEKNARQKGLSYLNLGRIHYDTLKNFERAKSYYDSAVQILPKDEKNFEVIQERQEILTDFVKYVTTVRENDSLLNLSALPLDSLQALVMQLVVKDSIELVEKQLVVQKAQQIRSQRKNQISGEEDNLISLGGGVNGSFYFDNVNAVSSGFINFQRTWGKIELEDHWRRSRKIINTLAENTLNEDPEEEDSLELKVNDEKSFSVANKTNLMLSSVPQTNEAKDKLRQEILHALYEIGNIYNFRLLEKENAISTFEDLLSRFPSSEYEAEVLYQLHLLQKGVVARQADVLANRLVKEYPESIYAKLIQNPNFKEESFAATIQLQTVYKTAYALYKESDFSESVRLIDSVLAIYPENEFSDNLIFLRALNSGQMEGSYKYQLALTQFIRNHPESELSDYAKSLVNTSDTYKINLYSSSRGQYKKAPNQSHYFILVYRSSQETSDAAIELMEAFIKETNSSSNTLSNILLSEDFSIVVVDNLTDKEAAMKLRSEFLDKTDPFKILKGVEYYLFAISEDNFSQMYQTKDLITYKIFFDKNYL